LIVTSSVAALTSRLGEQRRRYRLTAQIRVAVRGEAGRESRDFSACL
jgi:hypothetical protein